MPETNKGESNTSPTTPVVIGTAVKLEMSEYTATPATDMELKTEPKKITFITVEYKLKRKYVNTT